MYDCFGYGIDLEGILEDIGNYLFHIFTVWLENLPVFIVGLVAVLGTIIVFIYKSLPNIVILNKQDDKDMLCLDDITSDDEKEKQVKYQNEKYPFVTTTLLNNLIIKNIGGGEAYNVRLNLYYSKDADDNPNDVFNKNNYDPVEGSETGWTPKWVADNNSLRLISDFFSFISLCLPGEEKNISNILSPTFYIDTLNMRFNFILKISWVDKLGISHFSYNFFVATPKEIKDSKGNIIGLEGKYLAFVKKEQTTIWELGVKIFKKMIHWRSYSER